MTKTPQLIVVLAFWFAPFVSAHSHLANPLPTRRLDCRAGNGRPKDCYGPCPALDTYGEPTGVSPYRPAEVWKRGERRTITWHRNNHGKGESGFVRFTLVPIDRMMDRSAHEKFTFQVSCWASGLHRCRSRNVHVCGNDAEGKAYQVPIVVPSAYPDGVYAFGWAWYGGGDFRGRSFFGDYYSCSFIRIEGGSPVVPSCKPVFVPGLNTKYADGCVSAASRIGQCSREPCHIGTVHKMTPRNLPGSILRRDIDGQNMRHPTQIPSDRAPRRPNPPGRKNENRSSIKIKGLLVVDVKTKRMRRSRGRVIIVRTKKHKEGFTLALDVAGAVERVQFEVRGRSQTEYLPPFIVNGNVDGYYKPISCHSGEKFRVSCTIYGPGAAQEVSYRVKCL